MGDIPQRPRTMNGRTKQNGSASAVDSTKPSGRGRHFAQRGAGRGHGFVLEPQHDTVHERLVYLVSTPVPGIFNDLDFQLQRFMTEVTMNVENFEDRRRVMADLERLLINEFPQVQLHPFGSLITGLGDKLSDLDIYVDCNSNVKNGQVKVVDPNQKRAVFSAVQHILRRQVKVGRVFGNIIPIASARVPIIKAIHCQTKISCDLSFENFLSVRNSRLIQLYTRIDARVKPLMCLIRYWAKFHGLTDSSKIKNYGLILLILVYLTQNHIVPSIFELQNWTAKEHRCEIEDWDASFIENDFLLLRHLQSIHGMRPNASCQNILLLMLGFCKLFAYFDASKYVVCSLLGDFLPRTQFYPGYEQELPPEMNRYKEWCYCQGVDERLRVSPQNAFIIQDPFVLNYNVSGVTSFLVLQKFQVACTKTAELLDKFLSATPSVLRSAKLMDIFSKIEFPFKQKKGSGADTDVNSKNGKNDEVEENQVPGDKYVHKQLGFAARPTTDFCQTFWSQFSTCGLSAEEVIFRGSITWLEFVKNFFLSFFQDAFGLEVYSVIELLPVKKFLGPPKPKSNGAKPKEATSNQLPSNSKSLVDSSTPKSLIVPSSADIPSTSTAHQAIGIVSRLNDRRPSSTHTQKEDDGLSEPPNESDDGAESDDSSLSLSTIELISAIIRNPSPREILDSVDISTYRPKRLSIKYNGVTHNIWTGRGAVSSQLAAEKWTSETKNPLEREAEITRRLVKAAEKNEEATPIPVAFECSVTIRPENFKDVYAEVQLRESQGLHTLPFMKAIKSVMLDNITPYIQNAMSDWTKDLNAVTVNKETDSDESAKTEREKRRLKKKAEKKEQKSRRRKF